VASRERRPLLFRHLRLALLDIAERAELELRLPLAHRCMSTPKVLLLRVSEYKIRLWWIREPIADSGPTLFERKSCADWKDRRAALLPDLQ
jgi:hypothetical protein